MNLTMYSKLFARITESSLMEEPIPTRYTFMMLLAIADSKGVVVGTDIAIARRINMPIADFEACLKVLMAPDLQSNNTDYEGRRVIPSEGERGYKLVSYELYRAIKNQDGRREYMKEYMKKRRQEGK